MMKCSDADFLVVSGLVKIWLMCSSTCPLLPESTCNWAKSFLVAAMVRHRAWASGHSFRSSGRTFRKLFLWLGPALLEQATARDWHWRFSSSARQAMTNSTWSWWQSPLEAGLRTLKGHFHPEFPGFCDSIQMELRSQCSVRSYYYLKTQCHGVKSVCLFATIFPTTY